MTMQGKKHLADGKLRIEYVSFTDGATFYKADVVSGSQDASTRIYLEACNLPQDQITFDADESGKLLPFNNTANVAVNSGQIITYSFEAMTSSIFDGPAQQTSALNANEFSDALQVLLSSSVDNFKNLCAIGSRDKIFDDDGFGVGNVDIEFVINNDRPVPDVNQFAAHINHLDSLFNDVRFSRVRNFKFLPPINKISDKTKNKKDHRETSSVQLGHYKPWGRSHLSGLKAEQIEHELQHYESLGCSKLINFEPTSRDNKLMVQFFETKFDVMQKLDIIDFGSSKLKDGSTKKYFFIGKVLIDENSTHTFVHLFTLVFG